MDGCGRWWTRCWTWPMRRWPTGGSSPGAAKAKSCCRWRGDELLSVLTTAPACRNWLGVIGLPAAVSGWGLDDPGRQLAATGPPDTSRQAGRQIEPAGHRLRWAG